MRKQVLTIDDIEGCGAVVENSEPDIDHKAGSVPCEFEIIVDSMEQIPYKFANIFGGEKLKYKKLIIKTHRQHLPVADYAIKGDESLVIERKSKEDFFKSVGSDHQVLEDRIVKMSELYRYSAVVVECSMGDIFLSPPPRYKDRGRSIYGSVLSWQYRFPAVHWIFCGDRPLAEKTTFNILARHHEYSKDNRRKFPTIVHDLTYAYRHGINARLCVNKFSNEYKSKSIHAVYFAGGWDFASDRFFSGDKGELVPFEHRKQVMSEPINRYAPPVDMDQFPFNGKAVSNE